MQLPEELLAQLTDELPSVDEELSLGVPAEWGPLLLLADEWAAGADSPMIRMARGPMLAMAASTISADPAGARETIVATLRRVIEAAPITLDELLEPRE